MVGASGFEPHKQENPDQVKGSNITLVTRAIAIGRDSVIVPNSPAIHPSNPVKTGTVPVHR